MKLKGCKTTQFLLLKIIFCYSLFRTGNVIGERSWEVSDKHNLNPQEKSIVDGQVEVNQGGTQSQMLLKIRLSKNGMERIAKYF